MQEQELTTDMPETTETLPEENTPDTDWQAKAQELQQQLEDKTSKFLYLMSDFETYKRNAARERIELLQTAGREVIVALLPVLDDFDRAVKNGGISEGTSLIHQKLASTLKSKGLNPLEAKVGDDFNADVQEAIAEIPAPSPQLQGKIVDIVEQGYQLGDKVVRFAKVVVGR
jgi:molecular chaperone GrpE